MLGRIRKKLESNRRRLITYVCESGSHSAGMARPMIERGEIRVNGQIVTDTDYLLELDDIVTGYE